jgi:hypothetical protein
MSSTDIVSKNYISDREAHELIKSIFYHHNEAHPVMPTQKQIDEHIQARDRAIEKLKASGKRVVLVKADFLEECGRYLCDDDDGFSEKFEPLPGAVVIEQEV